MDLALVEDMHFGQERAVRLPEGVGKEEAEDDPACDREDAHQQEQPEPAGLAADTTHVQDAVREELGRGLPELVAVVEDLRGGRCQSSCRNGQQRGA